MVSLDFASEKVSYVTFIARWRHWCYKFVQYRVNNVFRTEQCWSVPKTTQIGSVVLKIETVKHSGLHFWPTMCIIYLSNRLQLTWSRSGTTVRCVVNRSAGVCLFVCVDRICFSVLLVTCAGFLIRGPSISVSPRLSSTVCLSVCLFRIRSRKLREIRAKFHCPYKKSGLESKNVTSDFAPEVARSPK